MKERCDVSANSRWLHAMNVTIRRPLESEGQSGMNKLSREALLLRSGVTLRPGVRPPRPLSGGGGEGERATEGGGGHSGTDEEDGLEPVTR